jgi:hypothetical protein
MQDQLMKMAPSPHNGNPHPFQGPILPGVQQMVQDLTDQFINNIAQQNPQMDAPDQQSNIGSIVQNDSKNSSTAMQILRGAKDEEVISVQRNGLGSVNPPNNEQIVPVTNSKKESSMPKEEVSPDFAAVCRMLSAYRIKFLPSPESDSHTLMPKISPSWHGLPEYQFCITHDSTGLRVNFAKSCLVPQDKAELLAGVFGYTKSRGRLSPTWYCLWLPQSQGLNAMLHS